MKLFSSDQINASYQKNQVLYISDKHIFTIILTIDLLTSIIIIYHSGWKKRIPFKILPKKWCYFDKWNKRLLRKKGGTFKTVLPSTTTFSNTIIIKAINQKDSLGGASKWLRKNPGILLWQLASIYTVILRSIIQLRWTPKIISSFYKKERPWALQVT